MTYFDVVRDGRAEAVQILLDCYAAAHGMEVVARFQDRMGCVDPSEKPELGKALDLVRAGGAQVLLVMSQSMISVLAEERAWVSAEIAAAGGAVVVMGWPRREAALLPDGVVAHG
ncbi:hypothetical protein [Streptomyces sp. B6B3]|uniref:hypothetical protein n=1 Tax=Streptomyces sp. B6B3 TaxID=3153570 RepID=UPI00325F5199